MCLIIHEFFLVQVLKYCANQLELDEEDMQYVPVDDFDDGTEGKIYVKNVHFDDDAE